MATTPETPGGVTWAAAPDSVIPMNAAATITFVDPLPGFEDQTEFLLTAIDDSGMLASLRSTADASLRFVVTPASVFFAEYRAQLLPTVLGPVADALGAPADESRIELFVMLTVRDSLADTTANLRAPIAVDLATGKAIQVIVDDASLPLYEPLIAA